MKGPFFVPWFKDTETKFVSLNGELFKFQSICSLSIIRASIIIVYFWLVEREVWILAKSNIDKPVRFLSSWEIVGWQDFLMQMGEFKTTYEWTLIIGNSQHENWRCKNRRRKNCCINFFLKFHFFLFLQKGDRILVLKMREDGIWEGQLNNGKKGIFPFRYVKIVSSTQQDVDAWSNS